MTKEPRSQLCRAFTLIELLLVIAIIGVLAALLLPSLQNAKEQGRKIQCVNNLHQLELAWLDYAADNPDNTNTLWLTTGGNGRIGE